MYAYDVFLWLYLALISLFSKVESIIGEHANLFKEHYYIKPSGNCDLSKMSDPHKEFKGLNVLIERSDASAMASKFGMSKNEYFDVLGACRKKLFDVRSKRPRPHLDDKVPSLATHVYKNLLLSGNGSLEVVSYGNFSNRYYTSFPGDCFMEWTCDFLFCKSF